MLSSPSTAQILDGLRAEINEAVLPEVTAPSARLALQMLDSVLANLSVRTHLRRFVRLTSGHSKKLENLKACVNIYMAWFNLCRVHETLRVTPAMQAGITDHIWRMEEMLTWTSKP